MDARTGRRQKRISKRQERQVATDLKGRTQANSGATRLGGGADVRVLGDTRVECKYTENAQYVLRLLELEKLNKQAIQSLEEPVLQFAFCDRSGRFDRYAVVKWQGKDAPGTEWGHARMQITVHPDEVATALLNGRIQVCFVDKKGLYWKYEIMRWEDYLAKRESDA